MLLKYSEIREDPRKMMTMNCVSMRNQAFRGKFHQVSSAIWASSGLSGLCSTPARGGICAACNLTLDREGCYENGRCPERSYTAGGCPLALSRSGNRYALSPWAVPRARAPAWRMWPRLMRVRALRLKAKAASGMLLSPA